MYGFCIKNEKNMEICIKIFGNKWFFYYIKVFMCFKGIENRIIYRK